MQLVTLHFTGYTQQIDLDADNALDNALLPIGLYACTGIRTADASAMLHVHAGTADLCIYVDNCADAPAHVLQDANADCMRATYMLDSTPMLLGALQRYTQHSMHAALLSAVDARLKAYNVQGVRLAVYLQAVQAYNAVAARAGTPANAQPFRQFKGTLLQAGILCKADLR